MMMRACVHPLFLGFAVFWSAVIFGNKIYLLMYITTATFLEILQAR